MNGFICLLVILSLVPMMLFFDGAARLDGSRRLDRLEGGEE